MTGVYQHRSSVKQIDGKIFIRSGGGDAQYGIPSAFDLQALGRLLLRQLTVELDEIHAHPVEE
jgi:hypothetical protein